MDASSIIEQRSEYLLGWSGSLISSYISIAIYGASAIQVLYYFARYERDRLLWKGLVATVFALDTLSLALFLYCLHYYLIVSWGPPDGSGTENRAYPAEFCTSAILVGIAQGFYINCVRILFPRKLVVLFLAALALTSFAFGLAMVPLYSPLTFNENAKRIGTVTFSAMLYISRSAALVCDVGIVATMWIALGGFRTQGKRASTSNVNNNSNLGGYVVATSTQRSRRVVKAILAQTIERGTLIVAIQVAELIAYSIRPCTMFFVPFHTIAIRVYSTSFLATLNARSTIIDTVPPVPRLTDSSTAFSVYPPSPRVLRIGSPPVRVLMRAHESESGVDHLELPKIERGT